MIHTLPIIQGVVLTLAVSLSAFAAAETGDSQSPAPSGDAGEGGSGYASGYAKGKAGAGTLPLDFWFPREALTPAQQRSAPEFCRGAYIWPDFPLPADAVADDQPVYAEARKAQYWESGPVILEGDVVVTQGNRTLRAPRVEIDHVQREGAIPGRVQIEEPTAILRGRNATLNLDSEATVIEDAEFLLIEPEFRGTAGRLEQDEAGDMLVDEGRFTRCEPGNNHWQIGPRSFVIRDGSDFGTARHAVVRVKNVPIFYTPYLSFPVNDERKSGWLFPSVGFSSQNGLEFAPPYYLNLAPNYDATLIPRYFQKRGWGAEAEFRHLSDWQQSRFVGSFLGDDKQYDGTYEKDDFEELEAAGLVEGPFVPADRWLYGMYHEGNVGYWQTTVNYTAVSDRDYFRNLDTDLDVASQRELERRGEIRYLRGGLDVRLWAQRFQRLDEVLTDPYQRLPELDISYQGDLPGALEWSVGASAVSFDRRNDDLSGVNKIVGERAHIEPRVRLPLSRSWGFMNFTGGYRYTAYDLRDTPDDVDHDPDRGIALGSVDTGLYFEKDLNFRGSAAVHTLEPRIFYLYQEYEDQDDLPLFDVSNLTFRYDQLWRDNRFSGVDRIGDANQLSVGLTSRLLDVASGREYLRASIGQIRYFEDRRVTRTGSQSPLDLSRRSEFAGELVSRFGRWSVGADLIWDPTQDNVTQGGAFVNYKASNRKIVHLGYRYQRDFIDQTDLAMIWPVGKRFALIGRWNFDLNTERTIEGLAGIEYNDCCWKLRLVGRRYLDTPSAREFADAVSRTGIFFQVVFKGLGSLDDSVENLLSESIRGYVMEEI
ncbi:MAG: LPS-assembly protein LptD [Gammaproteobacteria bacterium]|nr:MAG: LPS-assembly protein LptD [Gammaproteobacteria bacterium]